MCLSDAKPMEMKRCQHFLSLNIANESLNKAPEGGIFN